MGRHVYYWVLDGHDVREGTREEFAAMYEDTGARIVAKTRVGESEVSTVFLGIDHQFGEGPPLLFETMVFGGDGMDGHTRRYTTWAEAEAGHAEVVKEIGGP
jgi:hypothetical protein